jgi:hypothetical protein
MLVQSVVLNNLMNEVSLPEYTTRLINTHVSQRLSPLLILHFYLAVIICTLIVEYEAKRPHLPVHRLKHAYFT